MAKPLGGIKRVVCYSCYSFKELPGGSPRFRLESAGILFPPGRNLRVALAKAQGRDGGKLLGELIEESVRMREHPGIGLKGGSAGRRARAIGTDLDVWEMIELHRSMGCGALLKCIGDVSEASLEAAFPYCESYLEEIEAAL